MACVVTWRFALGILELRLLEYLDYGHNKKISNVNHLKVPDCGTSQDGIFSYLVQSTRHFGAQILNIFKL